MRNRSQRVQTLNKQDKTNRQSKGNNQDKCDKVGKRSKQKEFKNQGKFNQQDKQNNHMAMRQTRQGEHSRTSQGYGTRISVCIAEIKRVEAEGENGGNVDNLNYINSVHQVLGFWRWWYCKVKGWWVKLMFEVTWLWYPTIKNRESFEFYFYLWNNTGHSKTRIGVFVAFIMRAGWSTALHL